MKTAITVLQEMMVKLGKPIEYECISQCGPMHSSTFEYRCAALNFEVRATARSKKDAKQEVAKKMLQEMALNGHRVPPPYGVPLASVITPPNGDGASSRIGGLPGQANSYVALLSDLCLEYRLPAVTYELVGDVGPPHLRLFTIRARLGQHERIGNSTTKKHARQLAAEQLYRYLRENLARVTKDFVEEDALARVHERVMERFMDTRDENLWRPDLGQKVSDYHIGLITHVEAEKLEAVRGVVEEATEEGSIEAVEEAAEKLGLQVEIDTLPSLDGAMCLLHLTPTSPPLLFAGADVRVAAATALKYLKLILA